MIIYNLFNCKYLLDNIISNFSTYIKIENEFNFTYNHEILSFRAERISGLQSKFSFPFSVLNKLDSS